MKQLFPVLLCLLLLGCGQKTCADSPQPVPEMTQVSVNPGAYDPAQPMEAAYPGLVRAYPLPLRKVQGLCAPGKDVLILSGQGNTTLTLLTGDELREKASVTLGFSLPQKDPSLQIHEHSISFFDPVRQQTVLLDQNLREFRAIAAPEGLSGKPVYSAEGNRLYYCTDRSVMVWELESGIRRTVKELSWERPELTGLHLDGQILECTVSEDSVSGKRLLSSEHGAELASLPEEAAFYAGDSRYFLSLPAGYQTLMIFGHREHSPELLLPEENWQQAFYLPQDHAAVTACTYESGCQLNYYELSTGLLRSTITLPPLQTPKGIVNSKDHCVYILSYDPAADCDILYRWDVLRQPPEPAGSAGYTAAYEDPPEETAIASVREQARTLEEQYGIRILVGEEALAVQPWDYQFEAEPLAPVQEKELTLLARRLAQYPPEILEQTKTHFTGITICLVRSIAGTGDPGALHSATGIQFFKDREAYVVITAGKYSEQALYHELFHVMETHILTESTALDTWESLNPAGFVYGSGSRADDIYLQGQTRAFVDRYSMGLPKEDRARVLENAMLPEKEALFQSEYMQRKLSAVCVGIREAYGLTKLPESLPWEQYLINPLVTSP